MKLQSIDSNELYAIFFNSKKLARKLKYIIYHDKFLINLPFTTRKIRHFSITIEVFSFQFCGTIISQIREIS
jgi:hypothetical protein